MGIRINQNIMALNSYRNLTTSETQLSKSLEKLSSGFRINRAADDASGLVISEGLRSQVTGLKMAIKNTQDGVSVVQTAEGALTEVHSLLQRMRELAVQASSSGSSDLDARNAAQAEVVQLKAEVDRIAQTTRFGGSYLLDGSYGVTQAKVTGVNSTQTRAALNFVATDAFTIDIGGGARSVDLPTRAAAYYDVANGADLLRADLENSINGALALAGDDPDSVTVAVTGGSSSIDPFQVTLTGANGVNIALADGSGTPLARLGLVGVGVTNTAASGAGGVFQVGASAGETITFAISNVGTGAGGLNISTIDVSSAASTAITQLDTAIKSVSTLRGNLGALQNRFEHTISNLSVTMENLSASESRIRDTDMAQEMMQFTRSQILQQAGTAMLAQANQLPQSVLQLLR